jgi:hypothetical protein
MGAKPGWMAGGMSFDVCEPIVAGIGYRLERGPVLKSAENKGSPKHSD